MRSENSRQGPWHNIDSLRFFQATQRIGRGLTIRGRIRIAMAFSFLLVSPILLFGVMRIAKVARYSQELIEEFDSRAQITQFRLNLEKLRSRMIQLEIHPEVQNRRALKEQHDYFAKDAANLKEKSALSERYIETVFLVSQVSGLVKAMLELKSMPRGDFEVAYLTLAAIDEDAQFYQHELDTISKAHQSNARDNLSQVGRDQLILFLVLLFLTPVFIGLIPAYIVSPLSQLRKIARHAEAGRLKQLTISGQDEVSQLARIIKTLLRKQAEFDQKRSAKIFEIRNVLRALINGVDEPVIIVDRNFRINYANSSAAFLMQNETHYIEGKGIAECLNTPALMQALERAREGDVSPMGTPFTVSVANGVSYAVKAHLSAVRDREGNVSRIIAVLKHREGPLAKG